MPDVAPDYLEWVLGWRAFNFSDNGYAKAMTHDHIWSPGENRAECNHDFADVIHDGHHCGFNAYYDAKNFQQGPYNRAYFGLIRGRGERFAIHPDGFRSEYAEILAFISPTFIGPGPTRILQEASKIYGVPIFSTPEKAAKYGLKFGDFFPENRRPKNKIDEPVFHPVLPPVPIGQRPVDHFSAAILKHIWEQHEIIDETLEGAEADFDLKLKIAICLVSVSTMMGVLGGMAHVI